MATIDVTGDYTIGAGQELVFNGDQIAFSMHFTGTSAPTRLINGGSIEIANALSGIQGGNSGFIDGSEIWNQAGAKFIIRLSEHANAIDGYNGDTTPDFLNDGVFKVTSRSDLIGFNTFDNTRQLHFTNNDAYLIKSNGSVFGAKFNHGITFNNSGNYHVEGAGANVTAVYVDDLQFSITNSGVISADNAGHPSQAIGIQARIQTGETGQITNSGLIDAAQAIVETQAQFITSGGITVTNSGTIKGDVVLVWGSDHVVNTGRIFGTVSLGADNDVYSGANGLLVGSVHGDAGDDVLATGKGSDNLDGGTGNDTLTGGRGGDTLAGGTGADRFVYLAISDSQGAKLDTITDFAHSEGDKINLHAIDADSITGGNQDFHLAGSSFTGIAGDLIQTSDGSGHTLVEGDVDGDSHADFLIQLDGAPTLIAADFIL